MEHAHEKQPKIEIEDLQPKKTLAGYHASWQEGTLTAHAWLNPVGDQPTRGFTLEYSYNHVQLNRRLSDRQIDTGTTLISKVRELMLGQMARAGWVEIGKDAAKRPIWQHTSRLAKQPTLARPAREDGLAKARRKLERTIAEHQAEMQAARKQPVSSEQVRVTMDNFTISPYIGGDVRRNYEAKAVQGDVQALVRFWPLGHRDLSYPDAYFLLTGIDCYPFVPDTILTTEQKKRADALLVDLRPQVEAALVAAGWSVRWQSPRHGDLWTSKDWQAEQPTRDAQTPEKPVPATPQSEQAAPVDVQQRVLTIPAKAGRRQSRSYTRTITAQAVTFTCSRCGQEATKVQFPGKTPLYCDTCAKETTREQTRARVARLRTTRRESQKSMS